MSDWLLILTLALIAFINRYLFFSNRIKYMPSKKITHLLGFTAQSVMTALWVPIIFNYDAQNGLTVTDYHYLIPTLVVFVLSMLRLHVLFTITAGMAIFYLLKAM